MLLGKRKKAGSQFELLTFFRLTCCELVPARRLSMWKMRVEKRRAGF
jgi:hypothetical protein